jgi:hypothetical protein
MQTTEKTRPIYSIAREIRQYWKKVYFAAVPYLDAMAALDSSKDSFGYDSAANIIRYFLANASAWRGETAKRIKSELKNLIN